MKNISYEIKVKKKNEKNNKNCKFKKSKSRQTVEL